MNAPTTQQPTSPPDRRLGILLVGTQIALGGAQRLLLDQARWFHSHGHRVTAAFFYDKQDLGAIWRKNSDFPLVTLSRIGDAENLLKKVVGLLSGLASLWLLLRRERFDVVESFTYDSNLLALPLAWLSGVRARVATHHGIIEGSPRLVERLHSFLVNVGLASTLVCVSRKVLEQAAAAGIRREHMTVIPNGIPAGSAGAGDRAGTRRDLSVGDEDVLILSVGRLVYQKGHEYLVRAMEGILREYPGTKAIICGEGPLREQLETLIARLGIRAAVKLPGNRLDIDRFLGCSDIFVLPSRWEGLPVALLEAMDHALPVVATRVEGVEEVIESEAQGLLVPPEDARALKESLRKLIADPALRREMGAGARTRVHEAYTTDIMCEKYLALMHNLLQSR